MKKLGVLVAVIVLAGLAYWIAYPSYSWNQKLTVTVETPQGVISGSSVVAVSVTYEPAPLPDMGGVSNEWQGEAVIVELPGRRFLFMLLGHPVYMAQETFKAAVLGSAGARFPDMKTFYPILQDLRQNTPLVGERYPLLVTFTDINDPKSVKKVDPNNLAASFGAGFKLKAVTLEITDEAVTRGEVEKVLGWWLKMRSGPYNNMSSLKLPDESPRGWQHLGALSFWSLDRLKEFDRKYK